MPLIVTPGAPGADSYASLAEADVYHANMGNGAWIGADALKEAALRRATRWIDATYRAQFGGVRVNGRGQALEWPRAGAVDAGGYALPIDAIPVEIKQAAMEAALRELTSPGSLSPDYVAAAMVKSERVGPLSVEYAGAVSASSVQPVLTLVDGILAGLFSRQSGYSGSVVRA